MGLGLVAEITILWIEDQVLPPPQRRNRAYPVSTQDPQVVSTDPDLDLDLTAHQSLDTQVMRQLLRLQCRDSLLLLRLHMVQIRCMEQLRRLRMPTSNAVPTHQWHRTHHQAVSQDYREHPCNKVKGPLRSTVVHMGCRLHLSNKVAMAHRR